MRLTPSRLALALVLAATGCGAPQGASQADIELQFKAASETNDARFSAALAARGLTLATFPRVSLQNEPTQNAPHDVISDRDVFGRRMHLWMAGVGNGCDPLRDFARGSDGKIYAIWRKPAHHSRKLTAHSCPKYSEGCTGGMPPPQMVMAYQLPADAKYGGVAEIAYDVDEFDVEYPRSCQSPLYP